ncbi:MAG: GNAT family N-acetyltransferase [Humibacillus sp.]|nr:GNAT family N-acetyltransferase [Humibacillus sp.]MDN5775767.1 GNAT family N-acetyltransferase [Humibacillus sp.]
MSHLNWSSTTPQDVEDLVRLGQACLDRDGGLPDVADPEHLRKVFVTDTAICGRDELGEIVAAAAVARNAAGERFAAALVDPSVMGRGIGEELAAWVDEHSGGPVSLVMDSMSPEAEGLFVRLGLRRVFAETVMCHPLRSIPSVRLPENIVMMPFTDDTSEAFQHAYAASFRDQPGYDAGNARAWGPRLREQRGFQPEDSRVALDRDGHVAGFVTISASWIDEVGVVPAWRGQGLGAHLVARSLTAIAKRGASEAWLAVGCENPARTLYERLGFRNCGTRALFDRG